MWHIPALVRATAAGQAEQEAKDAATKAKVDAKAISDLRAKLGAGSYIEVGSTVTLKSESYSDFLLHIHPVGGTEKNQGYTEVNARSYKPSHKEVRWVIQTAPPK